MEANRQKPTSILVMTLSMALVGSVMFDIYKNRVENQSGNENGMISARVDSLSVVKEQLRKDVETAARNLQRRAARMESIVEQYNRINSSIYEKTALIARLKSTNAELRSWGRDKITQMDLLNAQINDLNQMKERLEQDLELMPVLKQKLAAEKNVADSLSRQSDETEKALQIASSELDNARDYFTADRFRVEVLNSRKHITAKASKGKLLRVTMLIPEPLRKQMATEETVYISILDKEMTPVEGVTGELNFRGEAFPVKYHAARSAHTTANPLELEFVIPLNKRLKPGIYVTKFHTSYHYLGSAGFTLKDSFLFF